MNKKVCRLCLACPSVCYSLLENDLSEMLEALTSIKVHANDMLSTISCMKCLLNIKLAFNIQQNILKADEKLKEITLLNSVEVKLEVSEVVMNPEAIENISLLTEADFSQFSDSEEFLRLSGSDCVICGVKVEGSLLTKHVQEHFTHEQTCDCCNNSFNNISEYKGHIANLHGHYQDVNYTCTKCGLTFRYKSLYNIHLKQAHKNSEDAHPVIEAPAFRYQLHSKRALQLLIEPRKNKRMEEGPFQCDECLKEFPFKRQLTIHAYTHQKKKCPICDAEISKSNLKKHVDNHSSGAQVCELCGATLRSLESLRGHMTHTHSRIIYNCEECGKVFKKKYPFLLHKKKHSGEKSHICETCGKAFLTLFYLNKHIKTAHLKLRPFICDYCNKGFSSKFALKTHRRQHTNETPYKCEICGEGFRQNISLRGHRKSKHNIVEPKTCACSVCGKLFSSEHAIVSHMRLHY